MKFDAYSGVLVCDEARCWGTEKMLIHTSEKIRPITSPEIQRDLGIVVCQGNTGTSTLGDEFIEEVKRRISEEYHQLVEQLGKSRPAEPRRVTRICYLIRANPKSTSGWKKSPIWLSQ